MFVDYDEQPPSQNLRESLYFLVQVCQKAILEKNI
jgi:hypothetical protein